MQFYATVPSVPRSSSGLFPLDFLAENWCEFFVAPVRATCPPISSVIIPVINEAIRILLRHLPISEIKRCLGSDVVVLCSTECSGQPLCTWRDHSVSIRGGESLSN